MLTPRRLLNIDATVYPSATSVARDEYNNPLPALAAAVAVKVWLYQTNSTEATEDQDTAQEVWTVFLMPAPDDDGVMDWNPLATFDHGSVIEVPIMALRLAVSGTPRRWMHPPTGLLSYLEVQTETDDSEVVS